MSEHRYIGSTETDEVELARLRLLEDVLDPITTRHLETVGVTEGWKCLEIGAGVGSVAQWLSTRVGSAGKVVATDVDTRLLQQLDIPNVEIRQHDIVSDELEADLYDLAHCRNVLMHLLEPEKGLKRMADSVRSGGWLVIEETDRGSILSADVTNPSAVTLTTNLRAANDFLRERKILDPYFGRQVRGLMEQLGFTDIAHEGWTCICRGGEPMARYDAASYQMSAKPMIEAGLMSQEQLDDALRLLRDPAFTFPALTMFSSWGKKPAQA